MLWSSVLPRISPARMLLAVELLAEGEDPEQHVLALDCSAQTLPGP
jgi:hypothetical protein